MESEADLEFAGVVFGLGDAFGGGFIPGFGFEDGELGVAVFEDVVGREGIGGAGVLRAFDAAGR